MAIVTSGFAERIKFSAYLVFALVWTTIVYDPLAHWVWGGGWAAQFGALDFAGGTVVHISSGFAALALALVIGKRVGFGKYAMEPHNIPLTNTWCSTPLVWLVWVQLQVVQSAQTVLQHSAFVTTNTAAAAGAMAWLLVSWVHGKPSSLGFVSGAVAGLVAITPGAGYVTPMASSSLVQLAGCSVTACCSSASGKDWMKALMHGHAMEWVACGEHSQQVSLRRLRSMEHPVLLEGNVHQFIANATGAFAALIYAFVVTYVLAVIIDKTIGLRVTEEEEYVGLDISQHGERC